MTRRRWVRHRPGPEENRAAAGIAFGLGAAVGVVVFYFARIFLSREPLESRPPEGRRLEGKRRRRLERGAEGEDG